MSAKPIVAAADGSEESLRAVEWAAREAVLRGAPLRIVSAAALLPRMIEGHEESDLDTVTDALSRDRDLALAKAAERAAKTSPGLLIDTDRLTGPPAQAVTESGAGALMLVVGSRGLGAFTAMVLGSVSRYVATHASCPVAVVRDETMATHRQVCVGIGDLDHCADSLTFAFEEAAERQASLLAVHSWHAPQSDISRAGQAFTAPTAHAVEAESRPPGWRRCSTTGGLSTQTSRSARTSCTAIRAGPWSACRPAPTCWSSAGTPGIPACRVPARSRTPY